MTPRYSVECGLPCFDQGPGPSGALRAPKGWWQVRRGPRSITFSALALAQGRAGPGSGRARALPQWDRSSCSGDGRLPLAPREDGRLPLAPGGTRQDRAVQAGHTGQDFGLGLRLRRAPARAGRLPCPWPALLAREAGRGRGGGGTARLLGACPFCCCDPPHAWVWFAGAPVRAHAPLQHPTHLPGCLPACLPARACSSSSSSSSSSSRPRCPASSGGPAPQWLPPPAWCSRRAHFLFSIFPPGGMGLPPPTALTSRGCGGRAAPAARGLSHCKSAACTAGVAGAWAALTPASTLLLQCNTKQVLNHQHGLSFARNTHFPHHIPCQHLAHGAADDLVGRQAGGACPPRV
jgi:hypothetical protein